MNAFRRVLILIPRDGRTYRTAERKFRHPASDGCSRAARFDTASWTMTSSFCLRHRSGAYDRLTEAFSLATNFQGLGQTRGSAVWGFNSAATASWPDFRATTYGVHLQEKVAFFLSTLLSDLSS